MELVVHVHVRPRESLHGLTAYEQVGVLDDPRAYGCVVQGGRSEGHLERHGPQEVPDVIWYSTRHGLPKAHLAVKGTLDRLDREPRVPSVLHDEIGKLGLAGEPLVLDTRDDEACAPGHSY